MISDKNGDDVENVLKLNQNISILSGEGLSVGSIMSESDSTLIIDVQTGAFCVINAIRIDGPAIITFAAHVNTSSGACSYFASLPDEYLKTYHDFTMSGGHSDSKEELSGMKESPYVLHDSNDMELSGVMGSHYMNDIVG